MTHVEYFISFLNGDPKNQYWYFDRNVESKNCYTYLKSIYDTGVVNNLKETFGDNQFFWLLPIKNSNNYNQNGTSFKVIPLEEEVEEIVNSI